MKFRVPFGKKSISCAVLPRHVAHCGMRLVFTIEQREPRETIAPQRGVMPTAPPSDPAVKSAKR